MASASGGVVDIPDIRKALCILKMQIRNEDSSYRNQTFGALCKVELREQFVNRFIGAFINLASVSTEDLSNAVLWFPYLDKELTIQQPNNMWREGNSIIIELRTEDENKCMNNGAIFLQDGRASVGQEVC